MWNPYSPFDIPGIVSPEDWDWRGAAANTAKECWNQIYPNKCIEIDSTKFLGLIKELDRLYEQAYPNIKEGEI